MHVENVYVREKVYVCIDVDIPVFLMSYVFICGDCVCARECVGLQM